MTIFFSVGEPSGDLHGANLIESLRRRSATPVRAIGYGGPRMASAGAELHHDLTQLAVMGFLQVLWKLPQFLSLSRRAKQILRAERPDAVVLIDFPGFNWHVARHAKRLGIPVFYYGTPQVWGWASWRVKRLRRDVDHALCKLPFEEPWLRERGVHATHIGHPYFDELHERQLDAAFVREQRGGPDRPLVALLPGSRTQEVRANFAKQLDAMSEVRRGAPDARFAVAAFKEAHRPLLERAMSEAGLAKADRPTIYVGRTPELIEASTCAIAVSGSVSLELLHHATPTVVVYHVSPFAYWLQSVFRRVPYITLVNLLTAPELFPKQVGVYSPDDPKDAHALMPEYLTCGDRSKRVAAHVVEWLSDRSARTALVRRMSELRDRVGAPGASDRASEYVVRELGDASVEAAA